MDLKTRRKHIHFQVKKNDGLVQSKFKSYTYVKSAIKFIVETLTDL